MDRKFYNTLAHRGGLIRSCICQRPTRDNRQPTQRPRGFSDLGKILIEPFSGRVWGEMGPPQGFLEPIQSIPLQNYSSFFNSLGGACAKQKCVFSSALFLQKDPQPKPEPKSIETILWLWRKIWHRNPFALWQSFCLKGNFCARGDNPSAPGTTPKP